MKDKHAYSSLKATRHLDIVQKVRQGEPVHPAHVQMILSDQCNQACNFCAYRDPTYSSSQLFYEIKPSGAALRRDQEHPERNYNPRRLMPQKKALEIIMDCKEMGVSAIQFTGGGEPTVHPDFIEIVNAAQERKIATSLVTNGVLIGKRFEKYQETLLRLSWIRFSMDAGTSSVYATIRNVPPAHFFAVVNGLSSLREAREKTGTGPVIGVGFVVTPENWRQVKIAARTAKKYGADNIRISAQFTSQGAPLFAEFFKECSELCADTESLTDDNFTVYNRFGQKISDLEQAAPDYDRCGYQFLTTYIGADLNVYRCCVLAYNERGLIGNLRDQSFLFFWNSRARAKEMTQFKARDCERCQFNTINRNLEYLLAEEDPMHSEFV